MLAKSYSMYKNESRDVVVHDRFRVVSEELNRLDAVTLHDVRARRGRDFIDIYFEHVSQVCRIGNRTRTRAP